ncbi:hypothetical protein ACW5F0_10250 [Luteimonas sp. A534]
MNQPLQSEVSFEERAENLSRTELEQWTVLSDAERRIVRKLVGPGAKLLSGPRGSGKSTLLRTAFYEAFKTKASFAVYVNYSRALAIEPLFHTHANATGIFRQWVLAKIIYAVAEATNIWGIALTTAEAELVHKCDCYIKALQSGDATNDGSLGPSVVAEILVGLAKRAGVTRCVLLLDDAAHAFSVPQQKEFFEIFRELRSRELSGKAAIYPGVTSFSPMFQVGHEAELLEAWFRPDEPGYLGTMRQVVASRFPQFKPKDPAVVDALALASFGLPRSFLNLCYDLHEESKVNTNVRASLVSTVATSAEITRTVFQNIADRLPRFKHYIEVGESLDRAMLSALRDFNKNKDLRSKAVVVALSEPIEEGLRRVIRFMEYAGLLRPLEGTLSKGIKGSYKRYVVHYSLLISSNSLSLGRSYRVSDIVEALAKINSHSLVKTRAETLLGKNYASECVLALPPCPNCSTLRTSEGQKFCMNCGQELKSASVYKDLLDATVDRLPLPQRKIAALKDQGYLKVAQVVSDESQGFRKQGSSIGKVWAARIVNAAEEWFSV